MSHEIVEVLFETPRLIVRAFRPSDTPAIHRILDEAFGEGKLAAAPEALQERDEWVRWNSLSHTWFQRMHQTPYGDRAIVVKEGGELIGSIGLVPLTDRFGQIPGLGDCAGQPGMATAEVGLFWAIDAQHRGRGYATEAARGIVDYAFGALRLGRIVATTEYDNHASQAVMRKIGMRLERNPFDTPPWLQMVGVLENTGG